MKKSLSLPAVILFFLAAAFCNAQDLRLDRRGQFKIVQFTDVHYVKGDPKSEGGLECIRKILRSERPDLVIFTGDVSCCAPALEGMRDVVSIVSKAGVPFYVCFGNHDKEYDATNEQMYDMIRTLPSNLHPDRGTGPVPDIDLCVRNSDGSPAFVLYCIDSHSYKWDTDEYEWITEEQIGSYRSRSASYTALNGGEPVPSLAFFHIPFPEYALAAGDQGADLVGTRMEKCYCPKHNSGLFDAMKECGDVRAVFVGHDHDNDYCVMWQGIMLAYGRYSGGDSSYHNVSSGARVILLHSGGL
ncbi:MAG: metallophosphoesterase family protein, partial [Candidatus Cryptobacteroides sp.]